MKIKNLVQELNYNILLLIFGVILMLFPNLSNLLFCYFIASILLISGGYIIYLNRKNNLSIFGICLIITSLVFLIYPQVIISILPIMIAIWLIISTVVKLKYLPFINKNTDKYTIIKVIFTYLMLISGIFLIFNPLEGASFLTSLVGIIMIVNAISNIIDSKSKTPKIKVIKKKE